MVKNKIVKNIWYPVICKIINFTMLGLLMLKKCQKFKKGCFLYFLVLCPLFCYHKMYSPLEQFKIAPFCINSQNGYFFVSFFIIFTLFSIFDVQLIGCTLPNRYSHVIMLRGLLMKMNMLKLVEHRSLITTLSLFTIFLIFNLGAIFPWIPRIMSHFSWTLGIRLSMSISALIISVLCKGEEIIVSVLPRGVPYWLHLPLTLIEVIGLLARSMALGIRISANIISGHVLLHLLSNFMLNVIFRSQFFLTPFILILLILFYFVEIGVALVQRYVFTLIMSRIVFIVISYWKILL